MKSAYYLEYLKTEFSRRKAVNKRYSLRRYAHDLGLQAPTLSHVIRGLRPLPWRYLKSVTRGLKLEGRAYRSFTRSANNRIFTSAMPSSIGFTEHHTLNDQIHAQIIEDWEHYAVLNYFNTRGKQDLEVMADRLHVSTDRLEHVLKNLLQAGLIVKKNNRWVKAKVSLRTTEDIPSTVLQKAHTKRIELAKEKMKVIDPLLRDISSITFAGNAEKMKEAKRLIRNFRKKLNFLMEDEESKDVFLLAIQLVPLTKPQE